MASRQAISKADQFSQIFDRLKATFAPYTAVLVVTVNEPMRFSLNTPASRQYPMGMFFGAARVGKN